MEAISLTILGTVALTSVLSGVLGMGGGMILMGVLALVLPVGQAMVVHGLAQLTGNGSRAALLRSHVVWKVVPWFLAGSLASMAVFSTMQVMTDKWVIYLALGVFPFLALKVKAVAALDIQKPWHAVLCGVLVNSLQLLAGAAGPAVDVFFLKTKMTRHEIVATKALTQTFSHGLKLVYYGGLMGQAVPEGLRGTLVATIAVSLVGTAVGARLLERMSDQTFMKVSRVIVLMIAAVYLYKGLSGLVTFAYAG